MEAISSSVFVALLRQKLAERARAKGTEHKRAAEKKKTENAVPQPSMAALAAQAGADDRHLRRTIIEQLLSDKLGAQLANEPRFQQIVDQVTEMIAEDAELGATLGEVMRQVRG